MTHDPHDRHEIRNGSHAQHDRTINTMKMKLIQKNLRHRGLRAGLDGHPKQNGAIY
jgi:hypothetical protein